MKIQILVELWRITEWKDNSVLRQEYVRDEWVTIDSEENPSLQPVHPDRDHIYANRSTSFIGRTIRRANE